MAQLAAGDSVTFLVWEAAWIPALLLCLIWVGTGV